ncbi:biopolymer transporter ExbD [Ornithobacterium rhinotracheale]|uniref:ExbD/TolR family protein n=1 Tax=Ornithobacterium rhinotracheale TaxID=28251 RepID=UPI00129C1249|nr:biopolymer transporter ExbD [Ornithobacterium rhinotracheale]MRI63217.1 biopolymer transporter ExbD [Ornithobacterium rhinotracheale]MRJ08858.1 biopolymer transporter ExbD [Ornithobacterium rhinotracheale]MRJ10038.1 biopolymer transporter ExbD [Ornithobacterium rhinotracheale]UOH77739.1 biopolymer transporter ExbD [Ornithobacterium rhinotracheale]
MSKFKDNSNKEIPQPSTAALPDIIFMLLFFFMIATSIRQSNYDEYIKIEMPKATALNKILKKDMVAYLYLGQPKNKNKYPQEFLLLLNDKPAQLNDIRGWVGDESSKKNGQDLLDYGLMTQLTIDKNAKVGFVQAIKEQLSYSQAFNVSYAGVKGDPTVN